MREPAITRMPCLLVCGLLRVGPSRRLSPEVLSARNPLELLYTEMLKYSNMFLALLMVLQCHHIQGPADPDPGLPEAFSSPERTFRTWIAASLAQDSAAVKDCYWPGLSAEELSAWLGENLRPEATGLLQGARWLGVQPVSRVEVNFSMADSAGRVLRGVMVRTRHGWKLQRW